jgi:hypothetical protein
MTLQDLTDADLTAAAAKAFADVLTAIENDDPKAEAEAEARRAACKTEAAIRKGIIPRPEPAPKRMTAYEAFCAKCEACRWFEPCSHAMNSTLRCTGKHQHEAKAA